MIRFDRVWMIASLACSCALFAPCTSVVAGDSEEDAREVSEYVLTEAGLARFSQAAENLGQLDEGLAGNCDDDSDADQSLDDMVAEIRAVPLAADAIESAGMPVREYVIFAFAIMQSGFAAWAMDQPGTQLPPGMSQANVDFFRAHEAELQAATSQVQADDCDEEEGWEEEGDYEE